MKPAKRQRRIVKPARLQPARTKAPENGRQIWRLRPQMRICRHPLCAIGLASLSWQLGFWMEAVPLFAASNVAPPNILWHDRVPARASLWIMNGTNFVSEMTLPPPRMIRLGKWSARVTLTRTASRK